MTSPVPAETWEDPPRLPVTGGDGPVLAVAGFEGPLPWLLELARTQRIDLRRLSILELVDAFAAALTAAFQEAPGAGVRADLTRWAEWLVIAAQLALLRSRLLLPADAPEAKAAQADAEALRRRLLEADAMRRAAHWLDARPQLGRAVFARGGVTPASAAHRTTDIADLLQACLLVLRVPEQRVGSGVPLPPLWRVPDAMARIVRLLGDGIEGELGAFLPVVGREGPHYALRCRAAVAGTFLAGLELSRAGAANLSQERAWDRLRIASTGPERPSTNEIVG